MRQVKSSTLARQKKAARDNPKSIALAVGLSNLYHYTNQMRGLLRRSPQRTTLGGDMVFGEAEIHTRNALEQLRLARDAMFGWGPFAEKAAAR